MGTVWIRVLRYGVVLALALLVAACGGGSSGEASDEPVKIGVNVEQSGPASVQGQAYVNALELRAKQINDQGGILGRQVELSIVDNRTDQTAALTETKRLADEGVVAMIGPGTSPTTLAAMGAILQSRVPVMSMGSADAIVDPVAEHPNVFKTTFSASLAAEKMLEHMQQQDIERIGLISVNNPYGDDGVAAWEALGKDGKVDVVAAEKFEATDTDMSSQLRNLMAADPQAIVVWSIPPGAPTVRRNAVQNLDVQIPMYFDPGAGAELFLELAGDAADGAFLAHPKTLVWDQIPQDDPQAEALRSFGESYTAAYGEMSGFAGYAWDSLGLLQAAMEKAGSTEPDAVIQALESLGEYMGVTGTFEFTPEDHQGLGTDDLVILEVGDGNWVPIDLPK